MGGGDDLYWTVEVEGHDDHFPAAVGKHHGAQRIFDFDFVEAEAQGIEQIMAVEGDGDRFAFDHRIDWNAGPVLVIPVPAFDIQVLGSDPQPHRMV